MGRSLKDRVAAETRKINRNNINPNMYESSFHVTTQYKDVDCPIRDFEHGGKVVGYRTDRQYKIDSYFIMTIEAFKKGIELSKGGRKLLAYILDNLPIKGNAIDLSNKRIAFEIDEKYSNNVSIYKKELEENNFIKRCPEGNSNLYNINIDFIFKGNRSEFIYEYHKMFGFDSDKLIGI